MCKHIKKDTGNGKPWMLIDIVGAVDKVCIPSLPKLAGFV